MASLYQVPCGSCALHFFDDDTEHGHDSAIYDDSAVYPWRTCHCEPDGGNNYTQYLPDDMASSAQLPVEAFFSQVCHEAIDICNDDIGDYSDHMVNRRDYAAMAWRMMKAHWEDHGCWPAEWDAVPENRTKLGTLLRCVEDALFEYYYDRENGIIDGPGSLGDVGADEELSQEFIQDILQEDPMEDDQESSSSNDNPSSSSSDGSVNPTSPHFISLTHEESSCSVRIFDNADEHTSDAVLYKRERKPSLARRDDDDSAVDMYMCLDVPMRELHIS
ncbi:hypothetical protein NLU13_5649 [Sarocladium strictum]|uniref:Uncharacterized protein n=1 Tax=Sarocladium strictum TaxID=5046 RepID=A0AA39GHM3_SARSR|nr:hypothetical protein NLU13_5649 [Sarocladium strictum]